MKYAAIVVFAFAATLIVTRHRDGDGAGAVRRRRPDACCPARQIGFADGPAAGARWPRPTSALCFASLGAVGLFVSTLTEQPIGATIAVVIFSTASFILDSIPQVGWLHPYLLTHYWLAFGDLFRDPVAWGGITQRPVRRRRLRRRVLAGRLGAVRRQGHHLLIRADVGSLRPGQVTHRLGERHPGPARWHR